MDQAGVFRKISWIDDSKLAELFGREVLADLVRKELLSPEWAQRLLSWRHTGFNVHSRVRAKTKTEAERVGKYMIRPLLSLERLSFSASAAEKRISYNGKKSTDGGSPWMTSQRITWTSGPSEHPAVAVDSSGNVHVVWDMTRLPN